MLYCGPAGRGNQVLLCIEKDESLCVYFIDITVPEQYSTAWSFERLYLRFNPIHLIYSFLLFSIIAFAKTPRKRNFVSALVAYKVKAYERLYYVSLYAFNVTGERSCTLTIS